MRGRGCALLLCIATCTSAEEQFIALPEPARGFGTIVTIAERTDRIEIHVAGGGTAVRFAAVESISQLTVLLYTPSHEALGVSPGLQSSELPCTMVAAEGIWSASSPAEDRDWAFVELDELPSALARAAFGSEARCRDCLECVLEYRLETIDLDTPPTAWSPETLIAIDETRALILSNNSPYLQMIRADGTITPLHHHDSYFDGDSRYPSAGVLTGRGSLWIITRDLRLLRAPAASLEATAEWSEMPSPVNQVGSAFLSLDGASDESGSEELFLVSSAGAFERFDGARWMSLREPDTPSMQRKSIDVARLGPGHGLAIFNRVDSLGLEDVMVEVKDGVVQPLDPVFANEQLTSIESFPDGTVYGGRAKEEVLELTPSGWRTISVAEFRDDIRDLAKWQTKLVGVGRAPSFVEIDLNADTACSHEPLELPSALGVALLGPTVVVLGSQAPTITFFHPTCLGSGN